MWTLDDVAAGERARVMMVLHRGSSAGRPFGPPVRGATVFTRIGHKAEILMEILRADPWRSKIEGSGYGLQPLFEDERSRCPYLTAVLSPQDAVDLLSEADFAKDLGTMIETWYRLARPEDEVLVSFAQADPDTL